MQARVIIFAIVSGFLITACSDFAQPGKKRQPSGGKEIGGESEPDGVDASGELFSGCPKYPLVFLHGFMGGSRLGNFSGVSKHFAAKGCKVLVSEVSSVNGIEFRSRQFADQVFKFLQTSGATKVNVVAHSQGGLDARYAISNLNLAQNVASLSMLSTPNLGTPVADFVLNSASDPLSQTLISVLLNMMSSVSNSQNSSSNNSQVAIRNLSQAYLKDTFNPSTPDAPSVYYQSWGARSGSGTADRIKITFALTTHPFIKSKEGENDGVVSVTSAKWGEFRGVIDADHLDLVGLKLEDSMASKFSHLGFLDELARDLFARGL